MQKKAVFLFPEGCGIRVAPQALADACAEENYAIELRQIDKNSPDLRAAGIDTPTIFFLPIIEEDCLSVKLAREALIDQPPCVIILYGNRFPSRSFLCLAFREGADDVLALEGMGSVLKVQLRRADKLLAKRREHYGAGGELRAKNKKLQNQCELLERKLARVEERLIALSSATRRIITGERSIADASPCALIVCASASQGQSAQELAQQLGFKALFVQTIGDALISVEQLKPGVVLIDGTPPDMQASDLAKSIRKKSKGNAMVIIAWSSDPDAEESLLAIDSGIDYFVLKKRGREGLDMLASAFLGALR